MTGTSSCRLLPEPRTSLKYVGPYDMILMALVGLDFGSSALGCFSIFLLFFEEELSTDSRRPRSCLGDASSVGGIDTGVESFGNIRDGDGTEGVGIGMRERIVQSELLESSPYLICRFVSGLRAANPDCPEKSK